MEKVAEKAGRAAPAVAIAGALVAVPQLQHALTATAKTAAAAAAAARGPAAAHQERSMTATLESISTRDVLVSSASKAQHAAAKTAAGNTYYTVRAGDTLSKIAERYYGNAGDWQWLYHENGQTVSNPNRIYPGQTLFVPGTAPANYTLAATPESTSTRDVLVSSASKAQHAAAKTAAGNTYYTVRAGDTLAKIAERYYGNAGDWQWLYHENGQTVSNPNRVYPGQTLFVPGTAPANYTLSDYVPRHAKPAAPVASNARSGGTGSASGGSGSTTLSGTLSCSGLELLWEAAGGNPADAFIAAEIAMAESGGNQFAHSPTADFGYWQINVSHGALATYDAYGNARAAITVSHDGTDWYPWTTYTSGAYVGRC
jgi:nucleoid-associated protein YgaU